MRGRRVAVELDYVCGRVGDDSGPDEASVFAGAHIYIVGIATAWGLRWGSAVRWAVRRRLPGERHRGNAIETAVVGTLSTKAGGARATFTDARTRSELAKAAIGLAPEKWRGLNEAGGPPCRNRDGLRII